MELRDIIYNEKKLIMIFFIVVSIFLISYSSVKYSMMSSEIMEPRVIVSILYLPLICYSILYLTGKNFKILNYFLNSFYVLSFFIVLVTKDILLIRYGLVLFLVPIILLLYVATEEEFDLLYFSRVFISMIVFFAILLFLFREHSIYIVLILAINAFIFTYFSFEIVVHNLSKRSAKIEEQ